MKIIIGKQYINKTWRFLIPVLKGHGEVFLIKFNPLFKLAVGIHDNLLDGSKISNGRNIYVLLDKRYRPKDFNNFINFAKYQDYFKGEYCPDSRILNSRKHMVIIEIPEKYNNAYDKFLKGQYSKMYTEEEIDLFFLNETKIKEYEVLTKRVQALDNFVKLIKNEFGEKPSNKSLLKSEWELPLKKKEEIFNCKDNERVFFNEDLDKVWQ